MKGRIVICRDCGKAIREAVADSFALACDSCVFGDPEEERAVRAVRTLAHRAARRAA